MYFIRSPQLVTHIRSFSSKYNRLGETDIRRFQEIIGNEHVIVDPKELSQIGTDWTGRFSSQPSIAVYPRTTEQISAILKHCHERKLPIIPQGGKTGLVFFLFEFIFIFNLFMFYSYFV